MLSDLRDLNERWYQAWLERDAATVERLMADDYLYIAPSGMVLDRQGILTVIRSPSYRLDHCTRTEVVVRPVGQDAAVVRHRVQSAGSYEGTSFTDDFRCVIVWERHAGGWRIVMEQCSFNGK
jgi:ketosteroid isomerase-like protein